MRACPEISTDCLQEARSWPFVEARRILERIERDRAGGPDGDIVLETGYGPSGLPHIGTFGEVFRTTLILRVLERMTDRKCKLIAFSDDMDGLRKVPDNIPNRDLVAEHLNKPLTRVPDPFGTHESFGAHNNARLMSFLDSFGFSYEFLSSTECYHAGQFDEALLRVLARYDEIMAVMLPTLGEERRQTYSPFLPVCPRTGHVLQVPVTGRDVDAGTVTYTDPQTGEQVETPVTGGRCKLQWKVDWAMRWHSLGVHYEMSGKDLIDSVRDSGRICRILGSSPPESMSYELFLDEEGRKISKSKGNGMSVEEWLTYGPPESLALFMFQQPRRAKRLFFDVIPKNTDDYIALRARLTDQAPGQAVDNPAWHIHAGDPPADPVPLGFGLLLNLASVCHAEDKDLLWGYITRYAPGTSPETHRFLDQLAGHAVAYYQDFVRPTKSYRAPDDRERAAFADLAAEFEALADDCAAHEIQEVVYEVGKRHGFDPLRSWFQALYQVLLGQDQGPRFGSFVALYGVRESVALITESLERDTG